MKITEAAAILTAEAKGRVFNAGIVGSRIVNEVSVSIDRIGGKQVVGVFVRSEDFASAMIAKGTGYIPMEKARAAIEAMRVGA